MDSGFMVPLVFFTFLGAIIIVPQVLKSRDRQRMYETMRTAYERGQPVPPQFVEAMSRRDAEREIENVAAYTRPPSERDLRRGIVWTAVGVGLVADPGRDGHGPVRRGGELRRRAPRISALHSSAQLRGGGDPGRPARRRSRPHRRLAARRSAARHPRAAAGPLGTRTGRFVEWASVRLTFSTRPSRRGVPHR